MDKIERVARAMCRARGEGPDADSGLGRLTAVVRDTGGSRLVTQEREPFPNWQRHEADARVFIAASEVLADD